MPSVATAAWRIRAFHPVRDTAWLHALWHRTMHRRWSLPVDVLRSTLRDVRTLLVAEYRGTQVGFCAADCIPSGEAGLLSLLVEPAFQRRGVGGRLLAQLESILRAEQGSTLRLGAVSGGSYFWPGLPVEQDAAWDFFERRGWRLEESCADLAQELADFVTPSRVSDRLTLAQVTVCLGRPSQHRAIAAFEATYFPAWSAYFQSEMAAPESANLLIAQSLQGAVLGTLLLKADLATPWQEDFGLRVGSLNTLGVVPERQGQGIGLALAARALEVLRDRGCSRCYIQWTGLQDWYGKLGARVWAQYRMASKAL